MKPIRVPRLAQNAAIYAIAPLIDKGLKFLILPLYSSKIVPAEYGAWAFILSVTLMLNAFAPLGLNRTYRYAQRRRECWNTPGNDIRKTSLVSTLAFSLLFYTLAFPLALLYPLETTVHIELLWAVGLLDGWLRFVISMLLKRQQMLEKPKSFAIYSLIESALLLSSAYVFVGVWDLGVFGIAYANLISTSIVLFPLLFLSRADFKGRFTKPALKESLSFGGPLILHGMASLAMTVADRFLLEYLVDVRALGIYNLSVQTTSIAMLIGMSLNQAYSPFFYRSYGKFDAKVRTAQWVMAATICVGVIAWMLVLPWLFDRFIDNQYRDSLGPAQVLCIAYLFNGLYFLASNYLFYWKKTKLIAISTATAFILNVVADVILIPKFTMMGAAWGTVIGKFAIFAFAVLLVRYLAKREQTSSL